MMKRFTRLVLACSIVLVMVTVAAAQMAPTPVTRIGDWVEIGNETFMNIIANSDIRYYVVHNMDFESDVRDITTSRDPTSAGGMDTAGDLLRAELRFGVDMKYQKNLRMRILLEAQSVYDGNLIDDRNNSFTGGCTDASAPLTAGSRPCRDGQARVSEEGNGPHIERFWIDYQFPGTPLHMRVGADLWTADPARVLGDDDPRFALYANFDGMEVGAWAVVQRESHRLGLTNDNDDIRYVFHFAYNAFKPHALGLDVQYSRYRYNGASGQSREGQKSDVALILPSYTGTFGPVYVLVQFNIAVGKAKSTNATGNIDYDVFAWSGIAYLEANLGMVRPFVGILYGSGDDDVTDTDLKGFSTSNLTDIGLFSSAAGGRMGWATTSQSLGSRDVVCPARAGICGGNTEFLHTTGNPWNDRRGSTAHTGIQSAYSNPGTLKVPAGLHILPVKGHKFTLAYIYVGIVESAIFETGGASIDKTMYHEIMGTWNWTLNRHFDIRLTGSISVPGDGVKDIAATVDCSPGVPCEGKDPALQASVRFRARF